MTSPSLKKATQDIINPTGRIDISPQLLMYEAQVVGSVLHYKLTIRNWTTVLGRLKGRELASLDFRLDNSPKVRISGGRAADALKRGGEIRGSVEMGDGVDPLAVSVTLMITDPAENHRIVARGFKAKADAITDDLADDAPEQKDKVRRLRDGRSDALSILDIRVSPNAMGKFSVLLDNVDVPTLLVSPKMGKKALLADHRLLSIVLPSTVREILTAMAFHPDEYDDKPWFGAWKAFAAKLSGDGDWNSFIDHDGGKEMSCEERRAVIDEAVAKFDQTHFSQVSFDAPTNDFHEE